MSYNWRTHEWKVGDCCAVYGTNETATTVMKRKTGRVALSSGPPDYGNTPYRDWVNVKLKDGCIWTFHPAQLRPLRKRKKVERWTLGEIEKAWNTFCLKYNNCRYGEGAFSEDFNRKLIQIAQERSKK